MSGIGDWVGDVALSDFDRIDRAKIAFWECCHCLELNKISDSVSGRCFSCHFQSQSPGHCRKPDHPQLQIETLLALRCTKEYYFYPRFVHPTDYKVKPPTPAEKRQIEKLRRRREEDYREMERHNHRELMPLSAHVTCGDCRLLNGYKEHLIFADKEKRKFVKGGVLWGLVNARLLEWQQTNKRTPALLPEFEKHVWDQFRMRANVDACFRTIDQFKCYRAEKLIHRSSSLGNCDPDLYPQCSMEKTKKIMMKTIERRISSAVRYNQPSAVLMFCQKFRIMHDHGYFRDTRLDEVKRHRTSDFQSKPSPLRQCFTRQVPKTDRRLTIVGLVDRTRIRSTNTAGQDEVEPEAYRQRHAAAQRRHAEFLRQYGEACDEHEAFQRMLDFHRAALQRILADDLEQRKQAESSATNGHAHQEPPSAT
ncbi:hypothetical protein N0V85_009250 [Neurospora sp. IMI 360204]|nr:hypothetical protein N0V85_009250 [Neurospora sp. IMI 360204]